MVNLLEKIDQLTHICLMLALIVLVIFPVPYFGKPLLERQRLKRLSGLKKGSWNTASGFVFGKNKLGQIIYSPTDKDGKHSFILGGSGTGKTSAVLIPCLSHFNGNFFAVDISGDISAAVHRKASLSFAPCEPNTTPYNVFALIDSLKDNTQAQYEQLEKLAFLIMPDMPGARDASLFSILRGARYLPQHSPLFISQAWTFRRSVEKLFHPLVPICFVRLMHKRMKLHLC